MRGEYEHLRHLLLDPEHGRLEALDAKVRDAEARLGRVPEQLAEDIEQSLQGGSHSRLANALSEATAGSLEIAVRRRPQAVVDAVYPVIGPSIRRALSDALRQMADDVDGALRDTFSLRALAWRIEAWRSGIPYAQVVLRHRARHRVEHLFLIQPESGLLLAHLTAPGVPELDADAVAGMFTAIHHFVRDSVATEDGSGIGSATVGGYRLAVSDGPHARLVALVRGVPSADFGARLDALNEEVHARHGIALADGDLSSNAGAVLEPVQLEELDADRVSRTQRRQARRPFVLALLCVVALALLAWGVLAWRWSMQSTRIQDGLAAMPGLVVLGVDDSHRGRLRIEGLLDPLAPDPRQWLAANDPGVHAEWKLRPYLSMEPGVVRQRIARALAVPAALVRTDDAGTTHVAGTLPFADWHRVAGLVPALAGIYRLDLSQLQFPQRTAIDSLVRDIEAMRIDFDSGTVNPTVDAEPVIADMTRQLQSLQAMGAAQGIAVSVNAVGYTDDLGSYPRNRELRMQRGQWLAERLSARLGTRAGVDIDQENSPTQHKRRVRATSVEITLSPERQ
jgi:outer membrane protein OmpA-like peptidoglycan-associated protein